MIKLIPIAFIFLIMIQMPSFAQTTTQDICITDDILQKTIVGNVCVDNECFNINRTENETCINGCDSSINRCFNSEGETNIIFIIIIISLIAFFLWLYKRVY